MKCFRQRKMPRLLDASHPPSQQQPARLGYDRNGSEQAGGRRYMHAYIEARCPYLGQGVRPVRNRRRWSCAPRQQAARGPRTKLWGLPGELVARRGGGCGSGAQTAHKQPHQILRPHLLLRRGARHRSSLVARHRILRPSGHDATPRRLTCCSLDAHPGPSRAPRSNSRSFNYGHGRSARTEQHVSTSGGREYPEGPATGSSELQKVGVQSPSPHQRRDAVSSTVTALVTPCIHIFACAIRPLPNMRNTRTCTAFSAAPTDASKDTG